MISIAITAYKEPNIEKAIQAIVNQKISQKYELIVAAPDKETKKIIDVYAKKYKQVKYFKDPGKGKSFALNLLFKSLKGEIIIFTDGDVWFDGNAINEIIKPFTDPKVGIVSGRVVSANPKNNMLGYWSHLLCDAGAHEIRKSLSDKKEFLECSAYLMAIRKGLIDEIPLHVAEDAWIPYHLYERGYKVNYAPTAKVYVNWPTNIRDWYKQKIRTAKSHETLNSLVNVKKIPRIKSFKNEVIFGWHKALSYASNLKEFYWTLKLFQARLIVWLVVMFDTKLKKKHYTDAWEKVESTK